MLLDEDDFRSYWQVRERWDFLLLSTTACNNPGTLKSMFISSSWVNCCLSTHEVSPFLFDLRLRFRLRLCLYLHVQQTVAHELVDGFGSIHKSPRSCVFGAFATKTRHLFRSPEWTNLMVAHPRVSPFLIIGFLVLVGFVGCPCCLSSNFWTQFLHPIIFKRKSLEEAEVTYFLSRAWFLQIPSQQLSGYNKLGSVS